MSHELSEVRARVSPGAGDQARQVSWAAAAVVLSVCGACGVLVAPAMGDVDPVSGIDFVMIGATGNAPYQASNPNSFVHNRGGVDYEYRIGRMEVTTAQWVEFFNAAFDRPDPLPHVIPPTAWGAASMTPNTPGGQRWTVPTGNELRPVGNISWRMAAMYCNWLHNGKGTEREAFLSGAYDVGTFTFTGNIFNDQMAHSPGARYWIPTWDEWLKAAHYDPSANNGAGGWWEYSNGSDTPYVYGPPGIGEANAGWDDRDFPGQSPGAVLLGAYPDMMSPWGLLDVAGGTSEWTESIRTLSTGQRYRVFDGSHWALDGFVSGIRDSIDGSAPAEFPHISSFEFGLRVAMAVPAPSSVVGAGVLLIISASRRRHVSLEGVS